MNIPTRTALSASMLAVGLLLSSCATQGERNNAPQIQISYENAEQFSDFKQDWTVRERDQRLLKDQLQRELGRVAGRLLDEGQQLDLHFTDINMAGEILPSTDARTDEIRVVKAVYPPSLEFDYRLLGADGSTLDSGSEVLRDNVTDLAMTRIRNRQVPLSYEVAMMERWLIRKLDNLGLR